MKTETIPAIENGTVIDHLDPHRLVEVMQLLDLSGDTVSIGLNMESPSMGKKAFIKVHDRALTSDETNQIALLSPKATISIIKDHAVLSKELVALPKTIERFVRCPNKSCVTNHEAVQTRFEVTRRRGKISLHCEYCECAHEH